MTPSDSALLFQCDSGQNVSCQQFIVCNSRFTVFFPVRKLSTAVPWRAGRRLTCLFNAASKALVHDVTSTISHYKETANCQHVTFWPRCLVHCHTAKPEPHRRVSFDPLPFWCLRHYPNVYVVLSMFISFWLRCSPNVVYPLSYSVHADVFLSHLLLLAECFLFFFVSVILYMCFITRWIFCYFFVCFIILYICL